MSDGGAVKKRSGERHHAPQLQHCDSRNHCKTFIPETSNSSNGIGGIASGVAVWPYDQPCKSHRRDSRDGGKAVRRSYTIRAIGPNGSFVVKGQTARALLALVNALEKGVTAFEVSSWAFRFAAYCHELRHKHHLVIDTIRENHAGGWHGRHILRSTVELVEVYGDE